MFDYLELSIPILERKKQAGFHVRELAEIILDEHPHIKDSFEDIVTILNRRLLAEFKKKQGSRIGKVKNKNGSFKKGVYRLKQFRSTNSKITPPPIINVTNLFTGKGGEHATLSELLFRGYNAGIMTVDEGIDIVASKDNVYHHIQVKTAYESNGSFTFSIKNKAFSQNTGNGIFYIFICRLVSSSGYNNAFIVFPSHTIQHYISNNTLKPNSNSIHIGIKKINNKFLIAGNEDITAYLNAFELIK